MAQLIAKLETLPQDSKVLTDKYVVGEGDFMATPIVVAQGIGYQIITDALGGQWEGATPWQHESAGQPLMGVPAIYIGSGKGIITPVWTLID